MSPSEATLVTIKWQRNLYRARGWGHESFLSPTLALGHLLSSVSSMKFNKSPWVKRARDKDYVLSWRLSMEGSSSRYCKDS